MTVTLAQMRSQLLTFDQAIEKLQKTEPLASEVIDATNPAKVRLADDWAENAKGADMTELVDAYITVGGKEYQFTKEGILQATALVGLRSPYVLKSPSRLIEDPLNYWLGSGLGDASHKLVLVKDAASAFVRPTISSFSNIQLAESILDGIRNVRGNDVEVLADFKFLNSLNRTDVRFIIPSDLKVMQDTNMIDVPADKPDVWSTGISMTNSLTGKSKTAIEAYMFRWWCTNGAIREHDDVGSWNRKLSGQEEMAVYEWAAQAVDEILGSMDGIFDSIQALNNIKLKGATADVLNKVFTDHKVPVTQRNTIQENLINSNEITMYSLMNAVTEQANNPTLSPERIDKMLRIGGSLPDHYFDDSKARIFQQGQQAGPDATNPYMVKVD